MRQQQGYSLQTLARAAKLSASYLSEIETGKVVPPSDEVIFRLAEVLGLVTDQLFALGGRVAQDVQDAIRKYPRELADLVLQAVQLPPTEIEKLARQVEERVKRRRVRKKT